MNRGKSENSWSFKRVRRLVGFCIAGLGFLAVLSLWLLGQDGFFTAAIGILLITPGITVAFWPPLRKQAAVVLNVLILALRSLGIVVYGFALVQFFICAAQNDMQKAFGTALGFCSISFLLTMPRVIRFAPTGLKKLMAENNLLAAVCLKHLGRLPLAADSLCMVGINEQGFLFLHGSNRFLLPMEQIMDVSIKTDREVKNYYVSNSGEAVAGALLFGAIGAAVGGRVQKISETWVGECLWMVFTNEQGTGIICFDCLNVPNVKKLVEAFWRLPETRRQIQL